MSDGAGFRVLWRRSQFSDSTYFAARRVDTAGNVKHVGDWFGIAGSGSGFDAVYGSGPELLLLFSCWTDTALGHDYGVDRLWGNIVNDELYELDDPAFEFLLSCAREGGSALEERDGETLGYLIGEGLITAKPVQARRPPLAPSPVPSLRYLELQITERCNLRCGHCYLGATEGHELSLDRLKDIRDQFEEIQGLRS